MGRFVRRRISCGSFLAEHCETERKIHHAFFIYPSFANNRGEMLTVVFWVSMRSFGCAGFLWWCRSWG